MNYWKWSFISFVIVLFMYATVDVMVSWLGFGSACLAVYMILLTFFFINKEKISIIRKDEL